MVKDTMAVRDINELKGHGGSTVHGIFISTGRAAVHGPTKGRITAVDHLINIFHSVFLGWRV